MAELDHEETPRRRGADAADAPTRALTAAMGAARVVAVLRARRYRQPVELAQLLNSHGLSLLEFTLTGENALEAIEAAQVVEGAMVGAGTVMSDDDARRAIDAGARFLLTPIGSPEIVAAAGDTPVVLAGLTPSEVWAAWTASGSPVKVFPASVGGPGYLRALAGPMPQVPLLPSGGVDPSNLGDYLAAGALAVNIGTALCPAEALASGDLDTIDERARELAATLTALRDD